MKKKICFPSNSAVSGGSNNSTLIMAKMLSEDYHVRLVYPEKGPITDKIDNEFLMDYEILPLFKKRNFDRRDFVNNGIVPKLRYLIFLIPYFIKVFSYIRSCKFDLIHANDLQSALIWGMAGRLNSVKVIWHVRQMRSSKALDVLRLWACDFLIFVAHQNKTKFDENVLRKKPHTVVHNCVDLNKFSGSESKDGQLRRIAYVSHLVPRKQPEMYLEASDILCQKYQDLEFLIIGEDLTNGYYLNLIREYQSKKHLQGRLQYLGYRSDINQLLETIDLLIFTSKEDGEAFPRVIIEAMACSTPVLSTNSAGAIESVHNNESGFLFKDVEDLIQKFDILMNDNELTKTFGQNGRIIAKRKFDCQQYKKKIEVAYTKVWRK